MPEARARVSRTGKESDFTTLISLDLGAVQRTLGVGGDVLVTIRQGQRRDAAATGEEDLGRFSARKSIYIRLYLYSGKLILPAAYLRQARVDGRSLAAGAPALTQVCTVGACGTKPRRGPPEAKPGDGAHCRSAAQRGHGANCLHFLEPQPNSRQQNLGHQLRDSFGVDSRFETARSSSAFNLFGLDSICSPRFKLIRKEDWAK
jgi:hypothetical protein